MNKRLLSKSKASNHRSVRCIAGAKSRKLRQRECEQPEPKAADHRRCDAGREFNHGRNFVGKHQPEFSLFTSSV
ncbi:hypothetical protein HID58_084657 [Brassica napus]|uniref:(rape) hypothetical protein n=1 Tax=Brassica napus TaxID=3708 RepID=A0A816IZ59_BRANA|nr:hypothetical protein HID58_084657 [Brassica napus]CAF1716411.1 unnamed protein product [Brassica napus]